MKIDDPRYELIRRQFDGEATEEDIQQLEAALRDDASFRADYVRYLNLDAALGAAAQAAALRESGTGKIATFPQSSARLSPHYVRWLAAAAACAALVVFLALPRHPKPHRAQPDVAAMFSSTENHIARVSVEPPSMFPVWASPTASLLDQPQPRLPR
jgi:hypothetical protein